MKYTNLILISLLITKIYCSEENSLLSPLTETEESCFNWVESQKPLLKSIYQTLSQADKDIITGKVKYNDKPNEVTTCISNYVKNFYQLYILANKKEEIINLPFDQQTMVRTYLKIKIALQNGTITNPRNIVEARIYVFTKLLSPEERETVYEQNYLSNTQATQEAMTKCGKLLAIEVAKLGKIKNTDEAKEIFATEWTKKKMEALEHAYKKTE